MLPAFMSDAWKRETAESHRTHYPCSSAGLAVLPTRGSFRIRTACFPVGEVPELALEQN